MRGRGISIGNNLFVYTINHSTLTGCKPITSNIIHICKICYKLFVVSNLNSVCHEPEPVLTYQSRLTQSSTQPYTGVFYACKRPVLSMF